MNQEPYLLDLRAIESISTVISASQRKDLVVPGAVFIFVARMGLPVLLTWLANARLRKIPGYRGKVGRVSLHFVHPRVVIERISLTKLSDGHAEQCLSIKSLAVSTSWRSIGTRALLGYIWVDSPQLCLNVRAPTKKNVEPIRDQRPSPRFPNQRVWQEKVKNYPAFRLSSVRLTNGMVQFEGIAGQNGIGLQIDRLDCRVENLTNIPVPVLTTKVSCSGRVMTSGSLQFRAAGNPLAPAPAFKVEFESINIDLKEVRAVIKRNIDIDVLSGTANLYVEAVAQDGQIQGYAKPVFDHLELEPSSKRGSNGRLRAYLVRIGLYLGRNKRKDRIATRIDFKGSLEDPDLNIAQAVVKFIRNGFVNAEHASFDHWPGLPKIGRNSDTTPIHYQSQPNPRFRIIFGLFKESFQRWSDDSAPRMAAALSYYTAFSMAPLLIVAIAIAGLVLGRDAAQGKIVEQIGGLVGTESAAAIQTMIQAADRPAKGLLAGAVGIFSLIAGAVGVLSELKSALNTIWRTQERTDVAEFIKKNVVLLGMLLGIGFLLTVSLILSAGIAAFGQYLGGLLPAQEIILHLVDFTLSVGITTVMFAAIYRVLPNAAIEWRDVWIGAAVTAVLFYLGKLVLGIYIGRSAIASSYGAAGAILVLLLWVYYSGLIFYFGAEFTKVFADNFGSRTKNKRAAQPS
jgi:membrane protein